MKALLAGLLEAIPEPAALLETGSLRLQSANSRFLELVPDGQAAGRLLVDILPPEDREVCRRAAAALECDALAGGASVELHDGRRLHISLLRETAGTRSYHLLRLKADRSGPELEASLRAANERLVMAAVASQEAADREERLRGEVERRAAELESIFAAVADPLFVLDAAGRVVRANAAAARIAGRDPVGLGRAQVIELLSLRDLQGQPVTESALPSSRVAEGQLATGEPLRARTHAGEELVVQPLATALVAEGFVIGAVALWRDISERERLLADLVRKTQALSEADRRKDEFMALLGHELRNPLAAISTSAQLMNRLVTEGPSRRSLDIILRQTQQLARMVDDLLDVARITHGRLQLRMQPVDLREPALRAVEAMRPFIAEHDHALEVTLPERALPVEGDPARLEQIVANLLHNAAKYSDPHGRIELRAWRDSTGTRLTVRDSGIGISPQLLPHIFEPFAQADRSLARAAGGLGLGLALVKQLLALHHGDVEVRSDGIGKGSTFGLRLRSLDGMIEGAAVITPVATSKSKLDILLVEDQADVAEPLAEQLHLMGHQVRVARTGAEALATAAERLPGVLLLDIGLPDMDGYEVARRIQTRADSHLPVIAISGYGQDETRRRSQEAGFVRHLVKPVDLDALKEILATMGVVQQQPSVNSLPPADISGPDATSPRRPAGR